MHFPVHKVCYPTILIVDLCMEFDRSTGNWYENRPMEVEANNALEYVYANNVIGEANGLN